MVRDILEVVKQEAMTLSAGDPVVMVLSAGGYRIHKPFS
jgi:hypothetical protein